MARSSDEVRALAFQKARLEPRGDGGDVPAPGLARRGRGELLRASREAVIAPADVDACFFVFWISGSSEKIERGQRQLDEKRKRHFASPPVGKGAFPAVRCSLSPA